MALLKIFAIFLLTYLFVLLFFKYKYIEKQTTNPMNLNYKKGTQSHNIPKNMNKKSLTQNLPIN